MFLFISGSYSASPEGIAASAQLLLDAMSKLYPKNKLELLTTNVPIIKEYIKKNQVFHVRYFDNWKTNFKNIKKYIHLLKKDNITVIHMEYPGNCYGKTLLASFLPLITKLYSMKKKQKIIFNVRLHEFTCARLLRRIAIIPILLFADAIYIPALNDRKAAKKIVGKKVKDTIIGANIEVFPMIKRKTDKKIISYFGSVYRGKGIKRMLNIWKQIKEADTENQFEFKIIGEINSGNNNHFAEYHKQVMKWLKQYQMLDFVQITGYVTEQQASEEIQNSYLATLFYEDGLSLRRGSFLAYLTHGIPIVTTLGDEESVKLLKGNKGVFMSDDDCEIVNKIFEFAAMNEENLNKITEMNKKIAKQFNWDKIAKKFLEDYGLI